ncbi:hypothetical protein GCM10025734_19230 [Kitasatospora paranensis]
MTGSALTASARITAAPDGRGGTALPVLVGAGPLAPRRTRAAGPGAHVTVVGSMAAPLGGDHLALTLDVRPGATLTVTTAAATVSLPGAGGEPARYDLDITVGEDAELHWLPEPVIAATGSHLLLRTRITLAPGARLRHREEQVLGRGHDRARTPPGGSPPASPSTSPAGRSSTSRPTSATAPPAGTAPPSSARTAPPASCSPSTCPPRHRPRPAPTPRCSDCPGTEPSCSPHSPRTP